MAETTEAPIRTHAQYKSIKKCCLHVLARICYFILHILLSADMYTVSVAVAAFALTVGAFILLGIICFAAFLAVGSSVVFAGAMYILALSRTTMNRLRTSGSHADWHGATVLTVLKILFHFSTTSGHSPALPTVRKHCANLQCVVGMCIKHVFLIINL